MSHYAEFLNALLRKARERHDRVAIMLLEQRIAKVVR